MATLNLTVAIVTNGLLAGLFFVFACAISPGFRRIDDHSYVHAYRAINTTILNGWFLLVFFLAPVSAAVSAVIHDGHEHTAPTTLLIAGAVCSMLTFVITAAANVPLNRALDQAPIATEQQQRAARQHFEARWNRWNLARTLTCTTALALLALASVM